MKILVFSDSHNHNANIQKAIKLHPDAKYLLHLGDGIADIKDIDTNNMNVFTVNGNFEDSFLSSYKSGQTTRCIEISGKKLFLCHGHMQFVNAGHQKLIYSAIEQNADIALYGHTHCKFNKYFPTENLPFNYDKGLYVFNPGSISRPRDSIYPSYGIIEIQENGILLSHGNII